jgi:hypothetical protein
VIRAMVARFPGQCASCSVPVAVGDPINYGGRGAVTHRDCVPVAAVRTRYGHRVYQGVAATGVRCIDAPCCGCCS